MTETEIASLQAKTPFYKNSRIIKTAAVVTLVTVAVLAVGSKLSSDEDDAQDSDTASA